MPTRLLRRIATFAGAAGLALCLAAQMAPAAAAPGQARTVARTASTTIPTAISWAISTSRATYGQALAVEYLVQMNFLGTWFPIPPSDKDKVRLQRRGPGSSVWRGVATTARTVTDKDGKRHYLLVDFRATSNASYRLVYRSQRDGIESATSTTKAVKVRRLMHDRGVNRSGRLYIVGNVDPGWGRSAVTFQRRTCATCRWRYYRTARTGPYGGYQLRVYAPRKGTWHYRAYVPATDYYLKTWTRRYDVRAR